MADVLFGDYDFQGKLSFFWPRYDDENWNLGDDGYNPMFPYGFGLKYKKEIIDKSRQPPSMPKRRQLKKLAAFILRTAKAETVRRICTDRILHYGDCATIRKIKLTKKNRPVRLRINL